MYETFLNFKKHIQQFLFYNISALWIVNLREQRKYIIIRISRKIDIWDSFFQYYEVIKYGGGDKIQ